MIDFPRDRRKYGIVETGQMRRVANATLDVHGGGTMVVWTGRQGIGKTTTAQWMVEQLAARYDNDDRAAFRTRYYETGGTPPRAPKPGKKALRTLFTKTLGPLDEGVYRRSEPEDLAETILAGLVQRNVQMVFIDEAGKLTVDAIRGLVLVRNLADTEGWNLTVVFIGMDDLPGMMKSVPQIDRRVEEWVYFKPYDVAETHTLLSELHPYFAGLDLDVREDRAQVEYLHEQYAGLPAQLVAYLRKLDGRQERLGRKIDMKLLKAVHLMTVRDKQRALADSR
jgi:type II secretory pathway predicted ATPase ExeA